MRKKQAKRRKMARFGLKKVRGRKKRPNPAHRGKSEKRQKTRKKYEEGPKMTVLAFQKYEEGKFAQNLSKFISKKRCLKNRQFEITKKWTLQK